MRKTTLRFALAALGCAALSLCFSQEASAQRKSAGGPITIGEITIVGRVPKPVAAVDVSKIQPKLALAELKQPFLERIEAATKRSPF